MDDAQMITRNLMDMEYQELLRLCEQREAAYLPIAERLSKEERQVLESYISVCEELSYREGCLTGM